MSRRKQSGEVNIGSDSFLDVIANMVGILIILIVIAGVRVSRAPVAAKLLSIPAPVEQTAPAEEAAEDPPLELPPLPEEPEIPETTAPPAELASQMESLRREIRDLTDQATAQHKELERLNRLRATGELSLSKTAEELRNQSQRMTSQQKSLEELQALIKHQQENLLALQSEIDRKSQETTSVKKIKHRVTPLSREVHGDQIHVRIFRNRVSIVPLKTLLATAMEQASRMGPKLMETRLRYGTVGPRNGFELHYKLEVQGPSTAEKAQLGGGFMRIALTSFKVEPVESLITESAEEAIRPESRFRQAIQAANPGSTFTLWVYPDSFQTYRILQEHLHELGFTVAGRPIPEGVPIAGSPDGTASAGQ